MKRLMRIKNMFLFGLATLLGSWAMPAGCFLPLVGGCAALNGAMNMTNTMGDAAAALTEMVRDQGVLDNFTGNIEGDVFNPGVSTEICMVTSVRLTGVQGSVDMSGEGTGTQLPKGVREELIRQLAGPLSNAQRESILIALGWNRVTSDHNP